MKFKSGITGTSWKIRLEESGGAYISTYYKFLEKLPKVKPICNMWEGRLQVGWASQHLDPAARRARKLRKLHTYLHRRHEHEM